LAAVQEFMHRGALVPDELAIRLILQRLAEPDAADGAILDGFRARGRRPLRSTPLLAAGAKVTGALLRACAAGRCAVSGRWLCRAEGTAPCGGPSTGTSGRRDIDGSELYQRDDDRPATVRARLERQLPPMYDVVDHYTERGVLTAVDGEQSIEQVTEVLLRAMTQPAR
jgi:adenylate kinase